LQQLAKELGLDFFATAFDFPSTDFLAEFDMPLYKIASGDLKNIPLIKRVASLGKPVIVSIAVGASTTTQRVYDDHAGQSAALFSAMHGHVSDRPAWTLHLRVITTLSRAFSRSRRRTFRPLERHRHGRRRLHAWRARRRKTFHAQSHLEGH